MLLITIILCLLSFILGTLIVRYYTEKRIKNLKNTCESLSDKVMFHIKNSITYNQSIEEIKRVYKERLSDLMKQNNKLNVERETLISDNELLLDLATNNLLEGWKKILDLNSQIKEWKSKYYALTQSTC